LIIRNSGSKRNGKILGQSTQRQIKHNVHLGGKSAVWVGHDWVCVVVGELVAHEPKRNRGVMLTSLAYQPDGHDLSAIVPLVDRTIYPADEYPDSQWDYYRFYTTHFKTAVADLDADKAASLASIFRSGDPAGVDGVSPNAVFTRIGGRFGAARRRLNLTRLSGHRRTSTCWCSRSRPTASVHPARGN
jgi:hypothetical protein